MSKEGFCEERQERENKSHSDGERNNRLCDLSSAEVESFSVSCRAEQIPAHNRDFWMNFAIYGA